MRIDTGQRFRQPDLVLRDTQMFPVDFFRFTVFVQTEAVNNCIGGFCQIQGIFSSSGAGAPSLK